MENVYLCGAGGHAKVILDILSSLDIKVSEIFDHNPDINQFMSIPVVHDEIKFPLIVSVGNNKIRHKIVSGLSNATFSNAISKFAIVSRTATIGKGTVVMQGSVIQSCAVIGEHTIINTGSTVDHDCKIDNFVHIGPGCNLCGNVEIGEGTLIGAGSTIIPGIKIGKWATIGAGSVIIKDIPDSVTAVGVPCKVIKQTKL